MYRILGVVAGLAIALAVVPRADALCMATEATDALFAPPIGAPTVLPTDGGILVGWRSVQKILPENQSAAWKVSVGGKQVKVTRVALAPGLTLLRPAGTGSLVVTNGPTEIARYTRDATIAPFAIDAPAPTALVMTSSPARYSGFYRTVTATLSAPVPTGAVAMITYVVRKQKRIAISFSRVDGGTNTAISFRDAGRCSFNPKGMEPPKVGEKATFVWVDAYGRLSKPSAAIAMTEIAPPTAPQP